MLRLLPTVANFFRKYVFLSADLVGNRTYSLRTHVLTRGDYSIMVRTRPSLSPSHGWRRGSLHSSQMFK